MISDLGDVYGTKSSDGQAACAEGSPGNPVPVLVVEDDANDVFFFKRAWGKANIHHPLVVCADGGEAMAYLASSSEGDAKVELRRPCMILTDLKMPRVDGFDLLRWLRAEPAVSEIPAVVLTSSNAAIDREKAERLGARDYFVKPSTVGGLVHLLEEIKEKWIRKHCGN